jgi:membrane complex biogenesis BtpA family protein
VSVKKLFGDKKFLIGMIHLPPLPGFSNHTNLKDCIDAALYDLNILTKAGFDAVLIENDKDQPHTIEANPEQISALTLISDAVVKSSSIPVGVQMMLNDWRSSFAIAAMTGCKFTRLDVFVDNVTCKWGDIDPNPVEIIAFKNKISPDIVLLTDIQVKYKEMKDPSKTLLTSAQQAIDHNTNGLVLTGAGNGIETPFEKLQTVKERFKNIPVIVGSGATKDNIALQMSVADGAIIGTSIKQQNSDRIDLSIAQELVYNLTTS